MKVLVTGGAGYIGSHMVRKMGLRRDVVVLDNLSSGHREAVPGSRFLNIDTKDVSELDRVLSDEHFDAVVHFAAKSIVSESVSDPASYYLNNVVGSINLIEAMRRNGVNRLVFSSTAAVYGLPVSDKIDERHPTNPINPYGAGKLMVEKILADAYQAYGIRSVSLRYFNAAGASPDRAIGESHNPETHLIPNVLRAVLGHTSALKVFGNDYDTPDGTCVRDFVHVNDIAMAHDQALTYLEGRRGAFAFNLGNGHGFSVRQVIESAQRVTGMLVPFEMAPRRAGDPAVLVASSSLARDELGWIPKYSNLDQIIETAWQWHRAPAF